MSNKDNTFFILTVYYCIYYFETSNRDKRESKVLTKPRTENIFFIRKKKSECVTNCYNSDLSPQEPRAFPKLPEFNAEDEFYDDWEPIYNGKYIIQ